MPAAPPQDTPEEVHSLTELITSLGVEGVLTVLVLAAILIGSTETGRKVFRLCVSRLSRYIRISLWGARLGVGYRLASRLQPDRWDGMVQARKLPGLLRGKVTRTPSGIAVRLRLSGSLTLEDVTVRTGQLEAGLGLRRGSARVKPVTRADKAVLHIVLRDPLAKPIEWVHPVRPVRLADPVKLAVTPFGDAVSLDVKQRLGIFGTSGSGKSCVQRLIGAHVVLAVDADLEIWDLKFGTESQHYAGKAHRVTTVEEAVARVNWLLDVEFPRRAELMAAKGTSTWKETPTDKALVLMIDEGNVIIREFSDTQLKRFFRVAEQGRALGVTCVWATQFPKASNLPTELRSQLNVRICLKLNSSEESAVVFKEESKEGWQPHKLKGIGWLLIKSDAHRTPDEARAVWLSEDTFKTVGPVVVQKPQAPVQRPFPPMPKYAPAIGPQPAQAPLEKVPEQQQQPRPEVQVSVTVADEIRMALAFSLTPMGTREIARLISRDPGAVSRALKKLTDTGDTSMNQDKKYSLVLAADQADHAEGKES